MKTLLSALLLAGTISSAIAQTNITITNVAARNVIHGNFNPSAYSSTLPISNPDLIASGIQNELSADSLKKYILDLSTFSNRNTGSDTISATTGIGAARRWALSKFQSFSSANENRLLTSYLQFDQAICATAQHRNVLAVLPGSDTSNHHIILIEGHMDSRCETSCDTACIALGIEDNATGTALVLELARVMSKYSYTNTIVFMITIGEEQGLFGAGAMALYAQTNAIPIEAVLNNDVIGGVICGNTSSAPSCPGLNDIDSTQVRLFSSGGFNSINKQLSRYIKLQYKEELLALSPVPMLVTIMSAEDRTGRGGDHIPFRQRGFAAMRFTSANEHGDASNGAGYTDRQHTSGDVLGVDTNGDMVIDSFFVDFNYLARNATINGVAASMAAIGPEKVDFSVATYVDTNPKLIVAISDSVGHPNYRVAIRTSTNDWDTVYTTSQLLDTFDIAAGINHSISVASVDQNGVESLFSREVLINMNQIGIVENTASKKGITLLQNRPNPFDEATIIGVVLDNKITYKKASIVIQDVNGKLLEELPITLEKGMNEVIYEHGYGKVGVYVYALKIDGQIVDQNKMIFAN